LVPPDRPGGIEGPLNSSIDAQLRRMFFEAQLKQTRDNLAAAQRALGNSGFTANALRAAVECYARLRVALTTVEVWLQAVQRAFAQGTPDEQQQTLVAALRAQRARLETPANGPAGADYVGKFREFKCQETLFDLPARQFELARLDESREATLIQFVDPAAALEWKCRPKRAFIAVTTALVSLLLLAGWLIGGHRWRLTVEPTSDARRAA
jgi:hypothetical protein